jgi:hypothetical protein
MSEKVSFHEVELADEPVAPVTWGGAPATQAPAPPPPIVMPGRRPR